MDQKFRISILRQLRGLLDAVHTDVRHERVNMFTGSERIAEIREQIAEVENWRAPAPTVHESEPVGGGPVVRYGRGHRTSSTNTHVKARSADYPDTSGMTEAEAVAAMEAHGLAQMERVNREFQRQKQLQAGGKADTRPQLPRDGASSLFAGMFKGLDGFAGAFGSPMPPEFRAFITERRAENLAILARVNSLFGRARA